MEDSLNKYYVYAYLDPRKPGKYKYTGLDFSFLYEPFYIGKGSGRRLNAHLYRTGMNFLKNRKIEKILNETGVKPYIIFIEKNISEETSLREEIKYIKLIGRNDLKTGPLTNLTDGGEGVSGRIVSEELKKRYSDERKGENNPMYGKEFSAQHLERLKGKVPWNKGKKNVYSEETKNKMGEKNKNRKPSKETIEKIVKKNTGKKRTKEFSEKLSKDRMKENNPMYGKYKNIVLQYSLDDIFIKEWNGISSITKELCYKSGSGILEVCTGKRKTSYGYKWKYK